MATLRMHRLIDRWSLSLFILFLIVQLLRILRKLGFKSKEDGWRKATRAYLRTEESKFILACFDLNFLSHLDSGENLNFNTRIDHIINKLAKFFKQQSTVHWQIKWGRFSAKKVKKDMVDIVYTNFDDDGNLKTIVPYFDPSENNLNYPFEEKLKNTLIQKIIDNYNQTKNLDDKTRPFILNRKLYKWLSHQLKDISQEIQKQARNYVDRILSATFIHFEELLPIELDTDYKRFDPPAFIKHKHPGWGILNIICRFTAKNPEMDLWIQCNHIAIDGLPMQEVLEELKTNFGKDDGIKFPSSSYKKEIIPQLCSTRDSLNGVYSVSRIINFRSFLSTKREISKKNMKQLKIGITPLRLLIWRLGNHLIFKDTKFLIPVDLQSSHNYTRTLGFVIIRPSIYYNKNNPEKGFFAFQKEFNRQVKTALARRSESYELLESYALLPPFVYSITLKLMPSAEREFVGNIGITIINRADLFIAPFTDVHKDGFIAISNFFMPTEDGDIGCYVSVKGPKNKIKNYLLAIEEIAKTSVN